MARNVVLICLDTVRKDFFDEFAPKINKRAEVIFSQCRAASGWSLPSHASMITGQLPHQHGIHTHNRDFSTLSPSETLFTQLPDHYSIGVSSNLYAGSAYGFDRFFDEFHDIAPHRRFPDGLDMMEFSRESDASGISEYLRFLKTVVQQEHRLKSVANGVTAKINSALRGIPIPKIWDEGATIISRKIKKRVQASSEPFFLFANYMDAHGPLQHILGFDKELHSAPYTWNSYDSGTDRIQLSETSSEHLPDSVKYHRELYSAAIDYLDRKLSMLIEWLINNTDNTTTVIITADHGDNLAYKADNHLFGHTSSLTEGILHVPFAIINPPSGYSTTETQYFSHLQLPKLIHSLVKDDTPDVFTDRIPAEVIGKSGTVDRPDEDTEYWDRMIRCVYEGQKKIVWDTLGNVDTYILNQNQPCWQDESDENSQIPAWASELFEVPISIYKSRSKQTDCSQDQVSDVTRDRLERLGYM
ncbi:sulfatase-like hydrolase/transferase [Halobellus rubicundus]|uniref:Sulfatase-like hydrolase/transferase n=1 Tax=Halobellus rubicundus TaxID=2996466 RepID=A0ABD5MA61_9EURY